ncbi:helix-turn-helix domain-containing protein [Halorubrum trueperi]|uniref:Helix-turn-helix domain-containing protein n=1 Tax=Halorubrum trueperi TaxID=2004704 RepID=A0ABD5UF95_9EURY
MTDATLGNLDRLTRERLAELPPTASLVYLELRNADGPRTLRQLSRQMARPKTSAHRALRQLHEKNLVTCSPRHTDPPSSEWSVDE